MIRPPKGSSTASGQEWKAGFCDVATQLVETARAYVIRRPKRDVERSRDNNEFAILWHQLQVCNGLLDGHKINARRVKSHHHSVHAH